MQMLVQGYLGLGLVVEFNLDRAVFLVMIGIALLTGANVGSLF